MGKRATNPLPESASAWKREARPPEWSPFTILPFLENGFQASARPDIALRLGGEPANFLEEVKSLGNLLLQTRSKAGGLARILRLGEFVLDDDGGLATDPENGLTSSIEKLLAVHAVRPDLDSISILSIAERVPASGDWISCPGTTSAEDGSSGWGVRSFLRAGSRPGGKNCSAMSACAKSASVPGRGRCRRTEQDPFSVLLVEPGGPSSDGAEPAALGARPFLHLGHFRVRFRPGRNSSQEGEEIGEPGLI